MLRTPSTMDQASSRQAQVGRLSYFLSKYSQPRFQLFLILLLTAAVGAGASFVLLKSGLTQMWLRYPTAAVVAYLTFLALLRAWSQHMLSNPNLPSETGRPAPVGNTTPTARDITLLDLLDMTVWAAEDLPVAIFIVAGVVIVFVLACIIIAAPVLLAEVLLDGLLVAGLWHRLKRHGGSNLSSAARATIVPAAIVVACLAVIGYALQAIEPGADSIGDLFL